MFMNFPKSSNTIAPFKVRVVWKFSEAKLNTVSGKINKKNIQDNFV